MRPSLSCLIHVSRHNVAIRLISWGRTLLEPSRATSLYNYDLFQHRLDLAVNFVSVMGWGSLWRDSHWVTCGGNEVVDFCFATCGSA